VLLVYPLDDLDRLFARGAARAVRDRHERRFERPQLGERRAQVRFPHIRFRGKELEREHRVVPREDLVNSHLLDYAVQRSGSPAIRRASPMRSRWVRYASVFEISQCALPVESASPYTSGTT